MSHELKDQLAAVAKARGQSMSDVVDAAVTAFLNPEDYKAIALRYLGDIQKENTKQLKRLDLIEETLGQFVYLYFFYTPEMPDDAGLRSVSIASARSRFNGFLGLVSKKMKGSKTYRDSFEDVLFAETDFHLNGGGK